MSSAKKTVTHYRDNCIGCGACTAVCPNGWRLSDDDGKAILLDGEERKAGVFVKQVHPEDVEENELAAMCCPVRIIKVG